VATIRKHRGNWVADFRDEFGKRHRERPEGEFENMALQRRAAASLLKKRLDEVERGSYTQQSERLTFAQVADLFLASKVAIRSTTRRSYEGLIELYLKPYFGDWKLHQISAADIERYRNAMMIERPPPIADAFAKRLMAERPALSKARAMQRVAKRKPGTRTINKTLTVAVMIFNYAARHRWIDFNPAEHVEKLKTAPSLDSDAIDSNVLAPNEVVNLLNAVEGPRRGSNGELIGNNYRLIVAIAIFTGMRSGEIRGLQWGDIDWNSRQIYVRRTWKEGEFRAPKTKASARGIPLPETLVSDLRRWRLECPKGEFDLVFPNLVGRPLSSENMVRRGLEPGLRRAGLRTIRFHDLRHCYASLLLASGEDIVTVSRRLGHGSPVVTMRVYAHAIPKDRDTGSERLVEMVFGRSQIGADASPLRTTTKARLLPEWRSRTTTFHRIESACREGCAASCLGTRHRPSGHRQQVRTGVDQVARRLAPSTNVERSMQA
jgi:integrase